MFGDAKYFYSRKKKRLHERKPNFIFLNYRILRLRNAESPPTLQLIQESVTSRKMYKCLTVETSNIIDVNSVTVFTQYKSHDKTTATPRRASGRLNTTAFHVVMKERAGRSLWPLPKHGHAARERGTQTPDWH